MISAAVRVSTFTTAVRVDRLAIEDRRIDVSAAPSIGTSANDFCFDGGKGQRKLSVKDGVDDQPVDLGLRLQLRQ